MKQGIITRGPLLRMMRAKMEASKTARLTYKTLVEEFNSAMKRAIEDGVCSVTVADQSNTHDEHQRIAMSVFMAELRMLKFHIVQSEKIDEDDSRLRRIYFTISV